MKIHHCERKKSLKEIIKLLFKFFLKIHMIITVDKSIRSTEVKVIESDKYVVGDGK